MTVATPLASMPPPIISLEPEASVEKQPAPKKEQPTGEEPKPQKAKATGTEPAPEKAKASEEEPAPEPSKATAEESKEQPEEAVVKMPNKGKSPQLRQETAMTESPTTTEIMTVVSEIQEAYPLPSMEFSGLLRMLEQAHKVSVPCRISKYSMVAVVPEAPVGSQW